MICFYDYKSLFLSNECRILWETLSYFNGLFNIRPTAIQISRGFKVQNLTMCESKVQVVITLGSLSFNPRHAMRAPPIGKRIWVGRYNKYIYSISTEIYPQIWQWWKNRFVFSRSQSAMRTMKFHQWKIIVRGVWLEGRCFSVVKSDRTSRALISKTHCTLSANQKRVKEFNV